MKSPKEWAKIARNFPGRTQHQIKNRFIRVLCKELSIKRCKICDLMNKYSITPLTYQTLNSLKFQKLENNPLFYYEEKNEQIERNKADEINEIRINPYSFNKKLLEDNVVDGFFYQENEEQNIEDFIKFDL